MSKTLIPFLAVFALMAILGGAWAADLHVKSGESVTIEPSGWRAKATLWLDATKAESMTTLWDTWFNEWGRTTESKGFNLLDNSQIIEWRDVRNNGYKFRSTACVSSLFDSVPDTAIKIVPSVSLQYGKTGLVLPANDKCRMVLGTPSSSSADIAVKSGVCVFNAALGGGYALFYDANKYFSRAASTDPYPRTEDPLLSGNIGGLAMRLGGERVTSPTTTGYAGGWQIVSFSRGGSTVTVSGLGQAFGINSANQNGGQIFGEILLFSELLTDTEMRQVEAYLANKWNLPVAHEEPESKERLGLYGAGTVTVDTSVAVTNGTFTGTINLNGNELELPSGRFPYTEATVPSAGRALWLDPSLAGAVTLTSDANKPLEVASLASRDNSGLLSGAGTLRATSPIAADGSADHRVSLVQTNRTGVAEATAWLEFDHTRYSDNQKNNLMLVDSTAETPTTFSAADFKSVASVKSAFFALDTTLGGGSQILTRYSGETGFAKRSESKASAILSSASDAGVQAASVRLDGSAVNGLTDRFSYRPEVMSLVIPEDQAGAAVKQFGYTGYNSGNREIMGEILLYTTTLDEATRGALEAYLMNKWLGRLPAGYADFRAATVTGSGVLKLEGPEYLPQLSDGFDGMVAFSRETWSVALGSAVGPVVGGVDLPTVEVSFPASVTVDVDCRQAAEGRHPLFRTGGLIGSTVFRTGSVTGKGYVDLTVEGDTVYATYRKPGLILIVR